MSMTETMYRVSNPTDEDKSWRYDSIPYRVPAGGSEVFTSVIAEHLKKYHDALELVPVEAHYREAGSEPPMVYSCPDAACGFTTNEFPKYHDHIREHLDRAKQDERQEDPDEAPTPAGFTPLPISVHTDTGWVPGLQVGPAAYGKVKVRLANGTEARVSTRDVRRAD